MTPRHHLWAVCAACLVTAALILMTGRLTGSASSDLPPAAEAPPPDVALKPVTEDHEPRPDASLAASAPSSKPIDPTARSLVQDQTLAQPFSDEADVSDQRPTSLTPDLSSPFELEAPPDVHPTSLGPSEAGSPEGATGADPFPTSLPSDLPREPGVVAPSDPGSMAPTEADPAAE
jgi:hypothetical protein